MKASAATVAREKKFLTNEWGQTNEEMAFTLSSFSRPIRLPKSPSSSREHSFHHVALHVGEAVVAATVAEGQARVIEAHQVQNGRVEIVDVNRVPRDAQAVFVGLAVNDSGAHARAREPSAASNCRAIPGSSSEPTVIDRRNWRRGCRSGFTRDSIARGRKPVQRPHGCQRLANAAKYIARRTVAWGRGKVSSRKFSFARTPWQCRKHEPKMFHVCRGFRQTGDSLARACRGKRGGCARPAGACRCRRRKFSQFARRTIQPHGSASTSGSSGRALPACKTTLRTSAFLRLKESRKARMPAASLLLT